jgi:hypothetical protein
LAVVITPAAGRLASARVRLGLIRQPKVGQRHAGEADAEFLQRGTTCYRLHRGLREFIELVVHVFPFFVLVSGFLRLFECVGGSTF